MERTFSERLEPSLTLTIGSKAHHIVPGHIRAFELNLHSWGLEGWVEFLVADNQSVGGQQTDELLADFLKPDLCKVSLELKSINSDAPSSVTITPLKVQGLVSDKTLTELPVSTSKPGSSVIFRRYGVRFVDAARLLWSQHFPCVLYTQKTLKDVIEAHKGEHLTLAYDWSAEAEATRPQLFVGLPVERGVSFYDFVLWFVSTRGGVFSYEHATGQYKLAAAKDASGQPLTLRAEEVSAAELLFPEVIRHQVTVLNSWAEGPTTEDVQQDQAVTGIRHDVLLRTPISDEAQARKTLEQARLFTRGLELELTWCRFPLGALMPGALVKLPSHASWATSGIPVSDTFRVRHLLLRGEAEQASPDAERDAPNAEYSLSLSMRLERKDEKWVELPEFAPPRYPSLVEGFIVSEVGEDKDETWQAYTDSKTSQDSYRVKIPLWEDQIITVPFEPNLLPGHFYFPAFKGERVLVALELEHSRLERFLDWRAGARLPADAQGVHLLVGKTTKSNTSMKHYYEDGKPVFLLHRLNEKDTAKLHIREGGLVLEVKEEKS